MCLKYLTLCIVLLTVTSAQRNYRTRYGKPQFRVSYEWSLLDFVWPTEVMRQQALSSREYIPVNNLITGVELFQDRMFLTLPRMRHGVPATLAWVATPNNSDTTSPLMNPFPSWEDNRVGDCRALQNVQSVEIDTNGVLWVIDGGRVGTMEQYPIATCPPKLILYDLVRNNQIVREYTFPNEIALHDGSFLNDLVIDDFEGRYAYITDNSGTDPGIIVYSLAENTSWKVREPITMRAATDATEFFINGTRVKAAINLDGIALGPVSWGPERDLFYTPLSSYHIYAISSSVLRNQALATSPDVARHIRDLGMKSSQTDGMIMDERGILYYGLLGDNAVGYWNTSVPFEGNQRLLARDATYIQWPDSFAIDPVGNLYLLTNRIQNFLAKNVLATEANYRILSANINARSYLYGTTDDGNTPLYPTSLSPQGRSYNPNFPTENTIYSSTFSPSTTPYVNIYANGMPIDDQNQNRYFIDGLSTSQNPLQDGLRVEYPYNAGHDLKASVLWCSILLLFKIVHNLF